MPRIHCESITKPSHAFHMRMHNHYIPHAFYLQLAFSRWHHLIMLRDLQRQIPPPHLPELPCGSSSGARLRGHETCFIVEGVRSVRYGADGGDGRAEQVTEFELAGGVRGSGEG